jgi:hypothetical protein
MAIGEYQIDTGQLYYEQNSNAIYVNTTTNQWAKVDHKHAIDEFNAYLKSDPGQMKTRDYHIHGRCLGGNQYVYEFSLRCGYCSYEQAIPPLYSTNEQLTIREAYGDSGGLRTLEWTIEPAGPGTLYAHTCAVMAGQQWVTPDPALSRIEGMLQTMAQSRDVQIRAQSAEIERLKQTIELLQTQLIWKQQELDAAREQACSS